MNDFILFYIIRKVITWILGSILILGGMAGLILPVIPGVLLLLAGLTLLAPHSERIRNMKVMKKIRTTVLVQS